MLRPMDLGWDERRMIDDDQVSPELDLEITPEQDEAKFQGKTRSGKIPRSLDNGTGG